MVMKNLQEQNNTVKSLGGKKDLLRLCKVTVEFSIPQLSRSFVAPVTSCLKGAAGIKFRISMYLQKTIM